jgi:hypothetical protein
LLSNTIKATTFLAAGQTVTAGLLRPGAVLWAEGALRTMMLSRLMTLAAFLLTVGLITLAGGTIGDYIFVRQPTKPEQPPEQRIAELVEKYGNESIAKLYAQELMWRHGNGIFFASVCTPGVRTLEAKLDQEKGEWTVTGMVRYDSDGASSERELSLVVRYTPSSHSWSEVSRSWHWPTGPGRLPPEWRRVDIKGLGKWIRGTFVRPTTGDRPLTTLRIVTSKEGNSGPRKWISDPGKTYSFTDNGLEVGTTPRGVTVSAHSDPRWQLRFGGLREHFLEVGEYSGGAPWGGVDFSMPSSDYCEFVVWRLT